MVWMCFLQSVKMCVVLCRFRAWATSRPPCTSAMRGTLALDTRVANDDGRAMREGEHERATVACRVRSRTPLEWLVVVRIDLDVFLQDHAVCERKVSVTAMTL